MAQREHLRELDTVRALAILGVLVVHSTSVTISDTAGTAWLAPYNFLNIVSKWGTPTFVFLSSFVLFYNYYDKPFTGDRLKRFYRNRFLYIVVPYLFFSTVYYLINFGAGIPYSSKAYVIAHYLELLISGRAHAHLYFVIVSVQFHLLTPVILGFFQRFRKAGGYAVPLGLGLQWSFLLLNHYILHITNKGNLFISWISYFLLGAFIGMRFEWIKDHLLIDGKGGTGPSRWLRHAILPFWLMSAVLFIGLWYRTRATGVYAHSLYFELCYNLYGLSSALLLTQAAFTLGKRASARVVGVLSRLGACSFGVYILHPLVLWVYRHHHPTLAGPSYHAWVLMGFACALGLSWGIVTLASRHWRFSWVLFGNPGVAKARLTGKAAEGSMVVTAPR